MITWSRPFLPMHTALVLRTLGILLFLFSGSLLPPLAVALLYGDGGSGRFATVLIMCAMAGAALWLPFARRRHRIRTRDGFIIVALLWMVMSLLSALPLVFGLGLPLADAFFESTSAFTTTGATVLIGLDALPPSILFYRQELQWLGGIGVVVSAIALLPMLGVGGMQLLRAETPGPMKDEKLTPRITHAARTLWRIYLLLTAACTVAYWLAGMPPFDAVAHAFSTVSTGGFSTHDASLAYFDSPPIEAVAVVFMLLGGINFTLHFAALHQRSLRHYWGSTEVRVFLYTIAAVTALTAAVLWAEGSRHTPLGALRYGVFEVVSVITSTGFGIDDFSLWPTLLPALLIFISFMGGCAGSTAGGMKVIRFVILAKQAQLEMLRLVHPKLVRPLKLDGRVVNGRIAEAVWGFFAVYVGLFTLIMLLLMARGMDQVTAFGAVATCLNNLGPGLGEVSTNFSSLGSLEKWLLAFAMLLGRLEIFTVFVVLTPAFWRE